jgi:hypothetical protein
MLVDPTRSQNITVIGRRSAVADGDAGAGLGGLTAVSSVPRAAIALRRRLRCPNGTPIFSRSASTRSRRTPSSISCSRNTVSYCPRSIAFSHWPTFIVVPAHGSSLMMVRGRRRVQAGSVGRPLLGRLDRSHAGRNGCYLRIPAGWSLRSPDISDRGRGHRSWADSCPPGGARKGRIRAWSRRPARRGFKSQRREPSTRTLTRNPHVYGKRGGFDAKRLGRGQTLTRRPLWVHARRRRFHTPRFGVIGNRNSTRCRRASGA